MTPGPPAVVAQAITLKPDETLVIRLPVDISQTRLADVEQYLEWQRRNSDLDLKYLIVVGEELAVQQAGPQAPGTT